LPRNSGIASGESMGRKLGGWDETDVGAVGNDAPVGVQRPYAMHIDSICRTAVYVWGATIILSGITTIILAGSEESKAA